MSGSTPQNLFPTMGEVATRTDALADVADDDKRLDEDAPPLVEQEDGDEREVQEIESLCMKCHEQGVTRMLLTTIPYFKEIIVMSFRCEHCGHRDSEINSAGEIQEKGVNYAVHLITRKDLDRQLVKSNWGTVTIPEFQLTIPPGRGQLTTVEGILRDTLRDLGMEQPVRRVMDPETAKKIDEMLGKLRDVLGIDDDEEDVDIESLKPFSPVTVTLDDPSGNSFFQFAGTATQGIGKDPQWNMRPYNRTFEQNVTLGLVARPDEFTKEQAAGVATVDENHKMKSMDDFLQKASEAQAQAMAAAGVGAGAAAGGVIPEEIFSFPSTCSSCGHELETLMQQVNIPYFQNIIIMATNCYACGYRDNEIKSGGAISDKGKKITLRVEDEEDLSRDLLKSDTAGLEIPDIDLVLQPGTLGGRFTTLEGLLNEIYNELSTKVFRTGDSATVGVGQVGVDQGSGERSFETFLQGLKECMAAEKPFTLIIDDPVSNSYLQNLYAPDPDPNMTIEEYDRTVEQNDDLGLNDIVLEGYEEAEGADADVEIAKADE